MALSVSSNASPHMLEWARKKAGLTIEDAAGKCDIAVTTLQEWEQGVKLPSYKQLVKLARSYRRPTMIFYLEERPQEFSLVKDYRRLAGSQTRPLSPEASFAIRDIQERQTWASEQLNSDNASPLDFVGSAKPTVSSKALGESMRSLLQIPVSALGTGQDPAAAYRRWRRHCESVGILVFHFRSVDISEIRGFAISDYYAPVVAINSKDSSQAKCFSLFHEVAHILLGKSGISDRSTESLKIYSLEKRCNEAAAEAIMPEIAFKNALPVNYGTINHSDLVDRMSAVFSCSRSAIAFRLRDIGVFSDKVANEFYHDSFRRDVSKSVSDRDRDVRIPREKVVLSRNGRLFSELAISAFSAGDIHGGELSTLLDMKINFLPKLEALLVRGKSTDGV